MKKKGKSLEKLVYHLEKILAGKSHVTIESPKKVRDKITGRMREHDVVLTIQSNHHNIFIAIECRDRSRPITVNQIESFWTKLLHTGMNQGIIVSPKGFWKTAREKAEHFGIRCLDLVQVESFNWLLASGIHIYRKKIIGDVQFKIIPKDTFETKPADFSVIDSESGNTVTIDTLKANALRGLNKFPVKPGENNPQKIVMIFNTDKLDLLDHSTNQSYPIKQLRAAITYETICDIAPFDLLQYREYANDEKPREEIADIAIAKLDLGKSSGKIAITRSIPAGSTIIFMPEDNIEK